MLYVVRRSSFLLLEVMIAFLLMALCLVPLLQPHFAMLQSDLMIVEESKLERVVQRLYADFLVALYRGEVTWPDVDRTDTPKHQHPIQPQALEGLPYEGYYVLRIARYPGRRPGEYSKPYHPDKSQRLNHLLEITYTFVPKAPTSRETREFSFRLYVQKQILTAPSGPSAPSTPSTPSAPSAPSAPSTP